MLTITAWRSARNLNGYGVFSEKSDKIYLTFEELEQIENKTFDRPALENARDWLLVGCYIGPAGF